MPRPFLRVNVEEEAVTVAESVTQSRKTLENPGKCGEIGEGGAKTLGESQQMSGNARKSRRTGNMQNT